MTAGPSRRAGSGSTGPRRATASACRATSSSASGTVERVYPRPRPGTTWQHKFDNGSSLQLLAYYDHSERYDNDGGPASSSQPTTWRCSTTSRSATATTSSGAPANAPSAMISKTPPGADAREQTLNLANVFAQDTISLTARLKLTAGTEARGRAVCRPAVHAERSAAWKATDQALLWAAVSRAVRSPTPVDENLREFVGPVDFLSGSTGSGRRR